MLQGVFIDEAMEVLLQLARDFGWSTAACAIPQALGALLCKALHPFTQGRIRQVEGRGYSSPTASFNSLSGQSVFEAVVPYPSWLISDALSSS